MGSPKCLCFDLRVGVISYAILALIASCLSAIEHLWLVITLDNSKFEDSNTFLLGIDFLSIAMVVFLIYGAYKELRMFLVPYLKIGCISLLVFTIVCIISTYYEPSQSIYLLAVAILWHMWSCVLSFYQLLDPNNPKYVPKCTATLDNTAFVESVPYYNDKMAEAV